MFFTLKFLIYHIAGRAYVVGPLRSSRERLGIVGPRPLFKRPHPSALCVVFAGAVPSTGCRFGKSDTTSPFQLLGPRSSQCVFLCLITSTLGGLKMRCFLLQVSGFSSHTRRRRPRDRPEHPCGGSDRIIFPVRHFSDPLFYDSGLLVLRRMICTTVFILAPAT